MSAPKRWKLVHDAAEATQALVVTGFSRLPTGRALFLQVPPDATGGGWLRALAEVAPVTAASEVGDDRCLEQAAAIAFTWSGLERTGLPDTALASFSAPFREGMFEEHRLRRLGDKRSGMWLPTVVSGGPRWSGNAAARKIEKPSEAYSVEVVGAGAEPRTVATHQTVHAILLLYTTSEEAGDRAVAAVDAILNPYDVKIVHSRPLLLDAELKGGFSREHFGYADGISQPSPFDRSGAVIDGGAAVVEPDAVHGTPLGEFVMGYENGHQEIAPSPVVPGDIEGEDDPRPRRAGLPQHPQARGFFDFGRNGSYLVVRELAQNVAAFWQSMDRAAALIRQHDPLAHDVTGEWIADRVVGRDRDGNVLYPTGTLPARNGVPDNDFLFFDEDRFGYGCPLGSHVRRANPRDALAPTPEMKPTLLKAANNHRILRRGRKYGPNLSDKRVDDGAARGLLFMCLNTDIARQFEFVQQTWLFNSDFATLFEEVDPLIGADGWMTIPQQPLRSRIRVETFVEFSGGDYFFLPSVPALRYLEML